MDKSEAEAAAKFQAEIDRAVREKEAGLDVEPPDDSRQLRNQVGLAGGVGRLRVGLRFVGRHTSGSGCFQNGWAAAGSRATDVIEESGAQQRSAVHTRPRGGGRRWHTAAGMQRL